MACLGQAAGDAGRGDVGQLDDGRDLRAPVGAEGWREDADSEVLADDYLRSVAAFVIMSAAAVNAQQDTARQNGDIVELKDAKSETTVSIVPSVGNIAFDMSVKGQKILRWPYASVEEFKAKPAMLGIPFMGPWANRLDEQAFYANGASLPVRHGARQRPWCHSHSRLPDHEQRVEGRRGQGRRASQLGRRAASSSFASRHG